MNAPAGGHAAGAPNQAPASSWDSFLSPRLVTPLLAVTVMIALVDCSRMRHATSWHFFSDAAHALFRPGRSDRGGLDVYATHPEFQFGPLSCSSPPRSPSWHRRSGPSP